MTGFAALVRRLEESRRSDREIILAEYLSTASPLEAAWTVFLLTSPPRRTITAQQLRKAAQNSSRLPEWLLDASRAATEDAAEAYALMLPHFDTPEGSLATVAARTITLLPDLSAHERIACMQREWALLNADARYQLNRIVLGTFRPPVNHTVIARALGRIANADASVVAHRLESGWVPSETAIAALTAASPHNTPGQPLPFAAFKETDSGPDSLGLLGLNLLPLRDGLRVQMIHRNQSTMLWSITHELLDTRFPEVIESARTIDAEFVIEGWLVAWRNEPLPADVLRKRLGRKRITARTIAELPVAFLAYDLLEIDATDLRSAPLAQRLDRLRALIDKHRALRLDGHDALSISEIDVARDSTSEGTLGVIVRPLETQYADNQWTVLRRRPSTITAVLMYAGRGVGELASMYSVFTFGVWQNGALVPIARTSAGLRDKEVRYIDAFVRRNATERFGPVRSVKPELVYEIAYDRAERSTRHRAGVLLHSPRVVGPRTDIAPPDAHTLQQLMDTIVSADKHANRDDDVPGELF